MTSIKTTQTLDRYSRILVPLPPVQSIKDEVGKLVEDEFKVTPEYVETDWCEGYAISWRSWYGFEDCLRYPSMRSFFPLRLKRIIDDWLDEDEDMQVIEWIDEERWEWLDVVKDYAEIFHASYPHDIRVYSEFITIGEGYRGRRQEIRQPHKTKKQWTRTKISTRHSNLKSCQKRTASSRSSAWVAVAETPSTTCTAKAYTR